MEAPQKKKQAIEKPELYEDTCDEFDRTPDSVDLIEFGMRDDIDWQVEGQRVLDMFDHPKYYNKQSQNGAA